MSALLDTLAQAWLLLVALGVATFIGLGVREVWREDETRHALLGALAFGAFVALTFAAVVRLAT